MGWFCRTASQALQNLASVTTDTLPVFLPFHSPFPPSKQCRWVSSLIACFASRCASRGLSGSDRNLVQCVATQTSAAQSLSQHPGPGNVSHAVHQLLQPHGQTDQLDLYC